MGSDVKNLKVGDRVVVPFPIACGELLPCQRGLYSLLRELEPERLDRREAVGPRRRAASSATRTSPAASPAARPSTPACPSPTSGPLKVADGLTDEQVLFLSDIFPTGYMGAEMCDIQPGDIIAVWGCGPVGQFAIAERLPARRRAGHRHRPLRVPAAHGAREGERRDDQLRGGGRLRGAQGDDRRPRSGRLHRRGRDGGAQPRRAVRLRPRQAGADARDRPPDRAARGDHGLPQRRHRLGASASTAASSTSSRWAR